MSTSAPTLRKSSTTYSNTTKKGGPTRQGLINFVDDKHTHAPRPFGWRKLFRRPVIRQFMKDGSIFREREEREPSRSELFFDLIFVGIIRQLTEGATEEFSGRNVAKFVLLFFPSWTIWQDTRTFLNTSGTDDVIQRLYILLNMALLLGYSANASAITLPSQTTPTTKPAFPTLRATVAFFLAARVLRLIFHLVYAFYFPKFRFSLLAPGAGLVLQSSFYVPLIWIRSENVVWILTTLGMVVDMFMRYSLGLTLQLNRWRNKREGFQSKSNYRPALNIEHYIERTSQFIIIVLGEAVLNLTYKAVTSETGLHGEFFRAVMGLIAAYLLCWLYFDQDLSQTYIHALRRHWFSALSANLLHFPFCCGLIIWSASMPFLVHLTAREEPLQGVRWYFSGGLATALLCLALLGWMHKNLDAPGSSWISSDIRLLFRIVGAIIIALLPLSHLFKDPSKNLGVHVGILASLVVIDTVGKIGTLPNIEEASGLIIVPQGREGETEQEARAVERASRDLADIDNVDGTDSPRGASDDDLPVVGHTITKKQELAISCS